MTTTYPLQATRQPRGARRVLLETGYNLSAFPIALVAFIVVLVDLTLGVGLSVLIGGVLLLSVGVMVARGSRGSSGSGSAACWDARPRRRRTPVPGRGTGCGDSSSSCCATLSRGSTWSGPWWASSRGTLAFAVTLAWWAGAGAGLRYWFWQQYLPDREPGEHELAYYLGFGDGDTAALVELVLGVLVLITLSWVVRLVVTIHASLASVTTPRTGGWRRC